MCKIFKEICHQIFCDINTQQNITKNFIKVILTTVFDRSIPYNMMQVSSGQVVLCSFAGSICECYTTQRARDYARNFQSSSQMQSAEIFMVFYLFMVLSACPRRTTRPVANQRSAPRSPRRLTLCCCLIHLALGLANWHCISQNLIQP